FLLLLFDSNQVLVVRSCRTRIIHSFYTEPRTCTGLWLALEDATINNGCLWAIPGSHKKGLVRRMVRDENGTHFDRPSPVYDQKEFVPLEVKSGALVVIHGDLIHQSFENLSPASRHAFSLHVVDTEGCKWSEDNWLVHIHNGIIEEFFIYNTILIFHCS
ncbi:Phytanoyl-CoA dioxygenase 1, partial [Zea mays]